MPRPYSDYINVSKEFVPVFSVGTDKKYPNLWKFFYPHDTFIGILRDLISSLEGTSAEKRMSLWVSGAYGTGKSFASFTLKHIIEENNENVKNYFDKYNISKSLFNRIEGIKNKGDILVIHRASSSGIVGDNMLFSAIQESIKAILKEKGYKLGGKTLYDNIIDVLRDENAIFNFKGAFNKYRNEFLEYSNAESVLDSLSNLGPNDGLNLLEKIIRIADLSGFNFAKTADDVVRWVDDVIKINDLYSIVFMWDEFTEYFQNNQNATTGLQEIAQASGNIPFYFLLITHKSHSQFIHDADTRKKLEDRFKMKKIEMANTTAFMLMRQALDFVPDLKNEWDNIVHNLWTVIEKSVGNSINKYVENVNDSDLKSLLPLHPFAAFILEQISSTINSNQRTMFLFLCGDPNFSDARKHNFRWFIKNHEYDLNKWHYLTCDYIWDYFFGESLNDSKTDLDERAKNAIIHYDSFYQQCANDNELRILKVALLLTAMHQEKGRGVSNLLRPTLFNISAAFAGTSIEDEVRNIMDKFIKKGIVASMPEGNDILYITQSQTIDPEKYRELEGVIRREQSFEMIISNPDYNLTGNFSFIGYAALRFEVKCATYKNLRKRLNEVRNLPQNKIPLIFVFAKNEEYISCNFTAIQNSLNEIERDIIIVDISSQSLTENEYKNFIKCQVKAVYFLKVNMNEANLNKVAAKSIIDTFKTKINNTTIKLYSKVSPPITLSGISQFNHKINEINSKIFKYGLEALTQNDRFFAASGFTSKVPKMGMNKETIAPSFSYLNIFMGKMAQDNIWNNRRYYTDIPTHTLSKMKIAVKNCITKNFEINSSVAIADIWEILKSKPFGLLECTGSAFVIGFLLKEYADSGYYLKDVLKNNVVLTNDKLADMIHGIIKGLKNADTQSIVKMTEEHKLFCKSSGEIFKLSSDKQNSVSDVFMAIRGALSNTGFPLWALKPYIDKTDEYRSKDLVLPIVELYCEFISSTKEASRDETKIAEEIVKALNKDAVIKDYLCSILNSQNLKDGMGYYIADYNPGLVTLAQKLGIDESDYIREIKKRLTEFSSWLWEKGEIDKKIDEVYDGYRLLEAINNVLHFPVSSFEEAATSIKNRLSAIKMPYELFRTDVKKFEQLFIELIKIYKTNDFEKVDKKVLYSELIDKSEDFKSFYNNQFKIFGDNISVLIGQIIKEDEINYLYKNVESNMLLKPLGDFENTIKQELFKYQKNKKYNILIGKWNKITDTTNPAQWSRKNLVPILCIFLDNLFEAKDTFDIINAGYTPYDEKHTEKAIEFLTTNKDMHILQDMQKCNEIFRQYVSGEYDKLITDTEGIKELLIKQLGENVYDWFINKVSIDRVVKQYAENKYKTVYYKEVFAKIDNLDPQKAKDYLKELIKTNPLVGIKIMEK